MTGLVDCGARSMGSSQRRCLNSLHIATILGGCQASTTIFGGFIDSNPSFLLPLLPAMVASPKTHPMHRDDALSQQISAVAKSIANYMSRICGKGKRWESRAELARETGIPLRTLENWSKGEVSNQGPAINNLLRLPFATEAPLPEILGLAWDGLLEGKAIIDLDVEQSVLDGESRETLEKLLGEGEPEFGYRVPGNREIVDADEFEERIQSWWARAKFLWRLSSKR